jgi:hypothetical protein
LIGFFRATDFPEFVRFCASRFAVIEPRRSVIGGNIAAVEALC